MVVGDTLLPDGEVDRSPALAGLPPHRLAPDVRHHRVVLPAKAESPTAVHAEGLLTAHGLSDKLDWGFDKGSHGCDPRKQLDSRRRYFVPDGLPLASYEEQYRGTKLDWQKDASAGCEYGPHHGKHPNWQADPLVEGWPAWVVGPKGIGECAELI